MREEVLEAQVLHTVMNVQDLSAFGWRTRVALTGPTAPLFLPPEHFQGRLVAKGRTSIPRQPGRSASCPNS